MAAKPSGDAALVIGVWQAGRKQAALDAATAAKVSAERQIDVLNAQKVGAAAQLDQAKAQKDRDGALSVVDLVHKTAVQCLQADEGINFENKIVLSIAVRLSAEQFMVTKLRTPRSWRASMPIRRLPYGEVPRKISNIAYHRDDSEGGADDARKHAPLVNV
jgi:hypothetical protein